MFHKLTRMDSVELPRQFTYPFLYSPHPLSLLAKDEVERYLETQSPLHPEIEQGKMFGVLIVTNEHGELGFLAAFSGQLGGSFLHPYFVPPIYDLNSSESFFREEEGKITLLNEQIKCFQESESYVTLSRQLVVKEKGLADFQLSWKKRLADAKKDRDQQREFALSPESEAELVKQSQFLKAQYRREKNGMEQEINALRQQYVEMNQRLSLWKEERKKMSADLQRRLFDQFRIYNAKGECRSLWDVFYPVVPPSGAGECALPKLLQYAYLHHYSPVCMAEFWLGKSPKSIIRRRGECYASCTAKCKPILTFMLQGLDVEPNPLEEKVALQSLSIVWEDDDLLVVNKPSGMLSVKGKIDVLSAEELLQKKYPNRFVKPVHRLDQATSGLLILAKSESMYVAMQSLFARREVRKRYLALLEGRVEEKQGVIQLPLCLDVTHRPCQMVSYEFGKPAKTTYEVLKCDDNRTWVYFYPHTGRTHQLRVHAAHPQGLGCAIVGDTLYGHGADRLYLQAQSIEFVHPKTGACIHVELPHDF